MATPNEDFVSPTLVEDNAPAAGPAPAATRDGTLRDRSEGLYVQFGAGLSAPDGWLNYDASPRLFLERLPLIGPLYRRRKGHFPTGVQFGNILTGLDLPSGSCQGIYCSHVLEHLSFED